MQSTDEDGNGVVKYSGAFGKDTTVEYVNTSGGFEENIVLNSYTGRNTFDFTFSSANYMPVLAKDKSFITIVRKDAPETTVYRMGELYMYDSYRPDTAASTKSVAGQTGFQHRNFDPNYSLTDLGNGNYTITVTVPEEYLTNPETVYPVTIDPSAVYQGADASSAGYIDMIDTYTDAASPDTNYNDSTLMRIGFTGNYLEKCAFVWFNLNCIPQNAVVNNCYISAYYLSGNTTGSPVEYYQVDSLWGRYAITGNNMPTSCTPLGSGIYPSTKSDGEYYSLTFNVTSSAQLWVNNPDANQGIDFEYDNAHWAIDTNAFATSERGDVSRTPKMTINYNYGEAPYILSGNTYYLKNKSSGQYLDVYNSNTANATNVQQWTNTGADNQKWRIAYTGGGLYKLVSLTGAAEKVLDVYPSDSSQGGNVDIFTDTGSSSTRFAIVLDSDGFSYRILSQCSGFSKAVTVSEASCSQGANVFQYSYNSSTNDEWIFEPYSFDVSLGLNYAYRTYNSRTQTYPDCEDLGGDCANFVSQCLLASGIHFQNNWWVFKEIIHI